MKSRKYTAVQELIDEIIVTCSGKHCIYRGTSVIHDEISSTIWRNHKELFEDPTSSLRPIDVEEEQVDNAMRLFVPNTSGIEVLTDLRHFGGDTNIIDFSKSLMVALFFACNDRFDRYGQIIALPTRGISRQGRDINYNDPNPEIRILDAVGTPISAIRSHIQRSVFVHAPDGLIPKEACMLFDVAPQLKLPCLEFLKEVHDIHGYTIYNDLIGYISIQKRAAKVQRLLYEGVSLAKSGKFLDAIKKYDEAIILSPNLAQIYYYRGYAYYRIHEFEKAMDSFGSAIGLDPENSNYHFGKSIVSMRLGDLPGSIRDLDNAIKLSANKSLYYDRRGLMKVQIGDFEGARIDFAQTTGLDPDRDK